VPKPNKCHYQDNMEKKLHRKNQTHSYCSDMTNIYCRQETQTIEFTMTQFENITGKNPKLYSHVVRIQGKQLLLKLQAAYFSAQHRINV
jgi:hypothetical protein